jgi:hypothetical protein
MTWLTFSIIALLVFANVSLLLQRIAINERVYQIKETRRSEYQIGGLCGDLDTKKRKKQHTILTTSRRDRDRPDSKSGGGRSP